MSMSFSAADIKPFFLPREPVPEALYDTPDLRKDVEAFSQNIEDLIESAESDEDRGPYGLFKALYNSERPSSLEVLYTYHLLSHGCELRYIPTLVHSVCIAAIKWNDIKLWQKWFTFCLDNNHISLFRPSWIAMSADRFGFEPVKAGFAATASHANVTHFLLGLLDAWLGGCDASGIPYKTSLAADAVAWLTELRADLCTSIGQSADDDYGKLIQSAVARGGLPYFQSDVLPLLTTSCTAEYLHKLAVRIRRHEAFFDSAAKDEIVARLLEASITRITLPTIKAQLHDATLAQNAIEILTSTMVSCAEAQCPFVLPQVMARVTDHAGLDQEETFLYVSNVLSPLLSTFAEKLAALAPPLSRSIYFDIQVSISKVIVANLSGYFGRVHIAEEDWVRLFNDALDCIWESPGRGGVDATVHALVSLLPEQPDIRNYAFGFLFSGLCRLYNSEAYILTDAETRAVLAPFMHAYVDCYITTEAPPYQYDKVLVPCASLGVFPTMLPLLTEAMRMPSAEYLIITDAAGPNKTTSESGTPLYTLLPELLKAGAEAFSMLGDDIGHTLGTIIKLWMQVGVYNPVTAIPLSMLSAVSAKPRLLQFADCDCAYCEALHPFLQDTHKVSIITIAAPHTKQSASAVGTVLDHLKQRLRRIPKGFTRWKATRYVNPASILWKITVTKLPPLFCPWADPEYNTKVQALLDMIAPTEAECRVRIGPVYDEIQEYLAAAARLRAPRSQSQLEEAEEEGEEEPLQRKKRRVES